MNIKDLRAGPHLLPSIPGSQVVTIFSPKGGVGKTLLAVSLAVIASRKGGRKTLLVDADLDSGDAAVHLDITEGASINDLLPYCGDLRQDILAKFVTHHSPTGVDFILAPSRPELSELVRADQIGSLLEGARRYYQCVVVDTPPCLDYDILYECLDKSDMHILVTTQDLASLKQARTALELLRRLGHNVKERTSVVINQFRERSLLSPAKITEFLGLDRVSTVAEDRDLVERCILDGTPVVFAAGSSQVAQDISSFACQVFGLAQEGSIKNRGRLPWFWRRRIL